MEFRNLQVVLKMIIGANAFTEKDMINSASIAMALST